MAVSDDQITAYLPSVNKLAWRYAGRFGAEYEDLVQEGMIAVWLSLDKGILPSHNYILMRMKNWVRYIQRHTPFERMWDNDLLPS